MFYFSLNMRHRMSDRGLELTALYFHPCERYALPNHPEFNRLYRCNIFKVYKYFFIYLENKNYLLHSFDCLKLYSIHLSTTLQAWMCLKKKWKFHNTKNVLLAKPTIIIPLTHSFFRAVAWRQFVIQIAYGYINTTVLPLFL